MSNDNGGLSAQDIRNVIPALQGICDEMHDIHNVAAEAARRYKACKVKDPILKALLKSICEETGLRVRDLQHEINDLKQVSGVVMVEQYSIRRR